MKKKMLVVLIILAIVLMMTAITIQLTGSSEVKTSHSGGQGVSGKVGVTVLPPEIEDKLSGNTNG